MEVLAQRSVLSRRLGALAPGIVLLVSGCREHTGTALDSETKRPISNATVFHAGRATISDPQGKFRLRRLDLSKPILVKAAGYYRGGVQVREPDSIRVVLSRLEVRGIYLSHRALGLPEVRARVLRWVDGDRLNTLVVDIKNEHGRMSFYNSAPDAGRMGAFGAVRFEDVRSFVRGLQRKHVYVVGRISVFQDALLAKHQPQCRPKSSGPGNLFWLDPFRKAVWAYNLAVVRDAAAAGFDEIQLDQVRFPNEWELPNPRFSQRDTGRNRRKCLEGFLQRARAEALPFNTILSLRVSPSPGRNREGDILVETGRAAQPEYWVAGVSTVDELEAARNRARSEPVRLRVWLMLPSFPSATGRPMDLGMLKRLIAAGEAARINGWVLSDPMERYDYPPGTVAELTSFVE